jgi:heme/copper-type cytochrome/quinol oxidase subunit 2
MLAFLFGAVGITEAKLKEDTETQRNLIAPKIPKLVEQSLAAPKLVLRDDYYSPRYLEVKADGESELTLRNKGTHLHGFWIPAFNSQTIIKPGEVKKVHIPKGKTGFYDFICPFHPEMKGTIEVL